MNLIKLLERIQQKASLTSEEVITSQTPLYKLYKYKSVKSAIKQIVKKLHINREIV